MNEQEMNGVLDKDFENLVYFYKNIENIKEYNS